LDDLDGAVVSGAVTPAELERIEAELDAYDRDGLSVISLGVPLVRALVARLREPAGERVGPCGKPASECSCEDIS
jgi:hypothetical protein